MTRCSCWQFCRKKRPEKWGKKSRKKGRSQCIEARKEAINFLIQTLRSSRESAECRSSIRRPIKRRKGRLAGESCEEEREEVSIGRKKRITESFYRRRKRTVANNPRDREIALRLFALRARLSCVKRIALIKEQKLFRTSFDKL